MSSISLPEKHERIRTVLAQLAAAQAPDLRVRLFSRASSGSRAVRGLMNPAPGSRPAPPPRPLDESALPPSFRPSSPEWASALRTGDELHVVVDTPRSGFLHVFNLGTSGQVAKLLPEPGLRAPVAAHQAYLASPGAGATPFFPAGPRAEPWVEQGPANGFPERVLAVLLSSDQPLFASDLNPGWSATSGRAWPPTELGPELELDVKRARPRPPKLGEGGRSSSTISGFAAPSVELLLSSWPVTDWTWGYCEIPVTD